MLNYGDEQPERAHGVEIPVTIERGMTFPQVASLLFQKRVIDSPRLFRLLGMQKGVTTKVRSGTYLLRDDMTPNQVIETLVKGVPERTVAVTIPEGKHALEVFRILEEAGVVSARELEALFRDPDFIAQHGIVGDTLEGYLFPETYQFRVPSAPRAVLGTLIRQHQIVWDRLRRQHGPAIAKIKKELGWNDYQLLIMASIVEKEAVIDSERPRIAQVFINRLTSASFQPKKLETDPTIRYGCSVPVEKSAACKKWDPTQRLRRAQLDDKDNPYNTYQHEGLPPGPIGNPGERSILATINPDGSKYFYFVAKDDRSHVFSKTLAEHETYVNKYQR